MQVIVEHEKGFYPKIEIDDAGWGDLVGGVIIGGYNPLIKEFRWAKVSVEQFQGEAFARKDYLIASKRAVHKVLGDLRADKRFHAVVMCTGYVLNYAAKSLRKGGWRVVRQAIKGPCQEFVEERFRMELIDLGVPSSTIRNMPSGSNRFMQLFNWVKKNPEEREQYVKTGWKSWHSKWKPRLVEQEKRTKS